jgi:hypothetical protein
MRRRMRAVFHHWFREEAARTNSPGREGGREGGRKQFIGRFGS